MAQNGLPLSYTQQWVKIYLLIAAPRPISDQEVLGLLTPWLQGKLKTPQMPSIKSVRVFVKDTEVGPVIQSDPFVSVGDYQTGSLQNNIVTGIKWNLRHPTNGAIDASYAGDLRAGFRATGKQTLERLGFKVMLMDIVPYNSGFGVTDYGIPSNPDLPLPPSTSKPIEQPSKKEVIVPMHTPESSLIYWAIGATALIFVALMTRKINGKPKV